MLSPLVFFVAGLPLALAARYFILRFSAAPAIGSWDSEASPPPRQLPWQAVEWRETLSRAFACSMPFLLVLAAVRFDAPDAYTTSVAAIALVVCCATDLLAYRVPNLVTLPALAAILVVGGIEGFQPFMESFLAASSCAVAFLVVSLVARGGLGGGDIKLVALIGAALGFPAAPIALAVGVAAGSATIILLHVTRVLNREDVFPFAPFLSIAALVMLFI